MNPGHCGFYVTGPLDPLSLRIKMAAFGGLLLASPVILCQLWRFITPGPHRHEKRYAIPFVSASVVLFVAGCALGLHGLPPRARVLEGRRAAPSLHQILNPNQYLSLILLMMSLFGLTFEFPVVLVALQLARVVTPRQLLHWLALGGDRAHPRRRRLHPERRPASRCWRWRSRSSSSISLAIGIGKLLGR